VIQKGSFWVGILSLLLALFGFVTSAMAHAGGTPRIVNQPAGDFVISVWTLPDPVVSESESNFIVYVAEAEGFDQSRASTPVLGANIQLTFTNGRQTIMFPATHERATNKLFYESYLELPSGGTWMVDVVISHEGLRGEAQFEVDVEGDASQTNWLLYGGIGLIVIAVGWFVWQSFADEEDDD